MATSTTTAIQLEEHCRPIATHREAASTTSAQERLNGDPLLQASQQADSEVPEGGYGWIVVTSCAVLAWWVIGTSYSWGVIQGALVESGLSTPAKLAFVGSLAPTVMAAIATLNSRIMHYLGVRNTGLVGVCLVGSAEILASFAVKSVPGLFVTEGALLGLGYGYVFLSHPDYPNQTELLF